MTQSKEARAKEYDTIHNRLTLVNLVLTFGFLIACFAIGGNGGLSGWFVRLIEESFNSSWAIVGLYAVGAVLFSTLLSLPLKFYSSYTLEHKYDLSNETVGGWFFDLFKSLAIDLVVSVLIIEVIYLLMRNVTELWWLWAAGLWIVFSILVGNLFPVLILPLFYKLKPVENKELVDKLVKLANRVNAKVLGVFEMDMSRKTKKANAMLAGLGNTKRIIFGDTLLKNFTDEEIEVILAHELGHFYHKHIWKLILVSAGLTFLGLYLANSILSVSLDIFGFNGFDDVANFPLLILVISLFFLITAPLSNGFSRACERQSDQFALDQTKDVDNFISAMEKLAEQNLANKEPNPIMEFFFHSHPSISKRVEMAKRHKTG